MALSSATVWECRATATAGCLNGGGYNSVRAGAVVDYSQQDTAHLSITDLQSDAADNTQVHSDLTPFDNSDIGNILHITATGTGFTVGWFEIIAVAGGIAVLDRSCGGTGLTGGTAYLGGALSLGSTLDNDFFIAIVSGNVVWIKNGSYTLGESVSMPSSGTITSPKIIRGYDATRGDNPIGSDRPIIDCGTSYAFTLGYYSDARNLIFTGSTSNVFITGYGSRIRNCKAINNSTTAGRSAFYFSNTYLQLIDCEAISYRGYAIYALGGVPQGILNCYCHDSNN